MTASRIVLPETAMAILISRLGLTLCATEALVTDIPEPQSAMPAGGGMGDMGMGGMM